jgi:hypothetical protein
MPDLLVKIPGHIFKETACGIKSLRLIFAYRSKALIKLKVVKLLLSWQKYCRLELPAINVNN